MKNSSLASFLVASLMTAGTASAGVVTFESQSAGAVPASFSDSGFDFSYTNLFNGFAYFGAPASCGPACASNGTEALYSFNSGSFTMSRSGGGTFSLLGLDLAQTFTTLGRDAVLSVSGLTSGGATVAALLTLPAGGADSFVSLSLPSGFSDLSKVTFRGGPSYPESEFALDNIVVSTGAVPEPASMALLGLGSAGLIATRRRQSRPA